MYTVYQQSGKQTNIQIGALCWAECATHKHATAVWDQLLGLELVSLSAVDKAVAQSTLHSAQGCMAALAHTLQAKLDHIMILDQNWLGWWLANQLHSEAMLAAIGAWESSSATAMVITSIAQAPSTLRS